MRTVAAARVGAGVGVERLDGGPGVRYLGRITAGMVKRYHESFPSFSYGFDSRYPLQDFPFDPCYAVGLGNVGRVS
jgi:hypothetical protein